MSMQPEPIREKIMLAILDRARSVDSNACRGQVVANIADLQVVTIEDSDENVTGEEYGFTQIDLPILVGAATEVPTGEYAGAEANRLLAKIRALMISSSDLTFGGLIDNIRYRGGRTVYGNSQSRAVGITAQFTVTYHTLRDDPYLNTLREE
jgi:hypothetical protein